MNDNISKNYSERFASQLIDPVGLAITIIKLVEDNAHNNSSQTNEINYDINHLIGVIENYQYFDLIAENIKICTKYPEIFETSGGRIVQCPSELIDIRLPNVNIQLFTLIAIANELINLKKLIFKKSAKSSIASVGKAVLEHVALSAIIAIPSNTPKQNK